ncbi:hypothetical protein D3H45_10310, partial [Streptococcus pyogenes]
MVFLLDCFDLLCKCFEGLSYLLFDGFEMLMWQTKFSLSDSRKKSHLSAYYTQGVYVDKVVLSEEAPNL